MYPITPLTHNLIFRGHTRSVATQYSNNPCSFYHYKMFAISHSALSFSSSLTIIARIGINSSIFTFNPSIVIFNSIRRFDTILFHSSRKCLHTTWSSDPASFFTDFVTLVLTLNNLKLLIVSSTSVYILPDCKQY